MGFDYGRYLRKEKMPHIWCSGCGHGIIMKALIRAIDREKLDQNRVVVVSGIGCASRMPGYLDFNTLHTTHGRALAFATGVKMADPGLHVIVISGDGDAIAIGGNHFIHSCRRNIGITMIVANNAIYGMTGGQRSPTTPLGDVTSTTKYGNPDPPFDISGVAVAAGASFVARTTAYHAQQMERLIQQGLQNRGFSVVEVLGPCFTAHGRRNRTRYRSNLDMLREEKETAINITAAKGRSQAELMGKVTVGVLHQESMPEYTDQYQKLIEKSQARKV
jgi:2-oxoglutarate ferredoxin oxidoreductase subunit beta